MYDLRNTARAHLCTYFIDTYVLKSVIKAYKLLSCTLYVSTSLMTDWFTATWKKKSNEATAVVIDGSHKIV